MQTASMGAFIKPARYPGRCGECGDRFEAGTNIALEAGQPPLCVACSMIVDGGTSSGTPRYDRFGPSGPGYYDRWGRRIWDKN